VELLIVIVVIAILATISVVAYNGVQQRASNTAIIDAASKAKRMIEVYIATYDKYPHIVDGYVCITTTTSCRNNSGPMASTPAFDTEVARVGSLPRSAPLASDVRGGVTYMYNATRTIDGVSAPVVIRYYLLGAYSDCGMKVIDSDTSQAASTSSNKYTIGDVGSSGSTLCAVKVSVSGT